MVGGGLLNVEAQEAKKRGRKSGQTLLLKIRLITILFFLGDIDSLLLCKYYRVLWPYPWVMAQYLMSLDGTTEAIKDHLDWIDDVMGPISLSLLISSTRQTPSTQWQAQ